MLDTALLEALERLTPEEQRALLAVAAYLQHHRSAADPQQLADVLIGELPSGEPGFNTPDEGLSPARLAARRFMRENPGLMRSLAQ